MLDQLRRTYYVTPTKFLELIEMFNSILNTKNKDNRENIDRYQTGLQKLNDAENSVDKMQKDIIEMQPKLQKATIDTSELIKKVQKEQITADEKKLVCEKEEVECNRVKFKANELKDECEIELANVEPILEAAKENLNNLSSNNIDFIKNLKILVPSI